jgi:hypothetical protein
VPPERNRSGGTVRLGRSSKQELQSELDLTVVLGCGGNRPEILNVRSSIWLPPIQQWERAIRIIKDWRVEQVEDSARN